MPELRDLALTELMHAEELQKHIDPSRIFHRTIPV
jgi:hypothetical protein